MKCRILAVLTVLVLTSPALADDFIGTFSCESESGREIKGNLYRDELGLSLITIMDKTEKKVYSFYPRTDGNNLSLVDFSETDGLLKEITYYSNYISINKANLKRLYQIKPFKISIVPTTGESGVFYSCNRQ